MVKGAVLLPGERGIDKWRQRLSGVADNFSLRGLRGKVGVKPPIVVRDQQARGCVSIEGYRPGVGSVFG